MKQVDLEEVMNLADAIYSTVCGNEGRPQTYSYGIGSSQVKALAEALVGEINRTLKEIQRA